MFFVLRKNDIILFALIAAVAYFTAALWLSGNRGKYVETFAVLADGKTVVIDAGHGGSN